jgi:protein SCO1
VDRRGIRRLVGAIVLLAGCQEPTLRGIAIDPPRPAPEFSITRATGERFSLAEQKGRAVLLFFGYTHCPDICPTTLADWAKVRRQLGVRADHVRFVFVSVDPARDTPSLAQRYATQFDSTFIGLAPAETDLPAIQFAFGVTSARETDSRDSTDYLMSHPSQAFLVAPDGTLRVMYSFGASVADVVADLERLLP